MARKLAPDDILDLADYAAGRTARRKTIIATKQRRRVALGPDATIMFESYDTMWHQVHEMLYIEQGVKSGRPVDAAALAAQIGDELAAYNPLIPNGRELVATIMFEIENPARRDAALDALGGVERHFSLQVGDAVVAGIPEDDAERTNEAGRASSVQFVHFPFADAEIALFRAPDTAVILACDHAEYRHMTRLGDAMRAELAADFDD